MIGMRHLREMGSFLGVGGVGYVVDVAIFNLLHDPLGPNWAKVSAVAVAMVVTFLGSTYVTWRDRHQGVNARQVALFVLFNVIGLGLSEGCLVVSHLLGFDGRLADNISANVIGMAFGTAFRFWAYRTWVFVPSYAEVVR